MNNAQLYPDWALPYLEDCYGRLVARFHAAATEREQILTWDALAANSGHLTPAGPNGGGQ
jgi:hypothetical protein